MKPWTEFRGYKIEKEDNLMILVFQGGSDWNYVSINHTTHIIKTSETFWETVDKSMAEAVFLHEIGHVHKGKPTNFDRYANDTDYYLGKELEADHYCFLHGGGPGLIRYFKKYLEEKKVSGKGRRTANARLYTLERLVLEQF